MARTIRSGGLAVSMAFGLALAIACGSSGGGGFAGGDGGASSSGSSGGSTGSSGGSGGSSGGLGASGSGSSSGSNGDAGPVVPACNDAACACTGAGGAWDGSKCTLHENPGGVSAPVQGSLGGGGTADSAFHLVYPYDATVFPRGLLPPTIQFEGAAPDATLVSIQSSAMDYQGFYGPSSPGRVQLSNAAWSAVTLAAKGGEQVAVAITKISGGKVTGPATQHWTVAQGSLRGVIYYETYGSQILGGLASVGIMQIAPGATQPTPVASGCGNVCHTASADGSTLVSANGFGGITSISYDLKGTIATRKQQSDQSFVYGGLYPDGSIVMSATNYRTWFGAASKLYDTKTGAAIAASGWDGVVTNAAMPAFSPDGKQIVFNHEDAGGGKSLATMQFDLGQKKFSGLQDVATDPASYLGWPAFTPDARAVVYHAGNNPAFETDSANDAGIASAADLYAVDLASKTKTRLDALDGYAPGGATYLPAADPNLNFAPTVLPEAVGGYFWVVFTSHRSYGNTLPSKDNDDTNGKLWVAALDIGASAGVDPSHPAFYLAGQEDVADNLRGFWVLDPCRGDGAACGSGDDCCGGYCRPGSSGGAGTCASSPSGCSNLYDKCSSAGDCCDSTNLCINGRCAAAPPK